jgi:hypothetical protein
VVLASASGNHCNQTRTSPTECCMRCSAVGSCPRNVVSVSAYDGMLNGLHFVDSLRLCHSGHVKVSVLLRVPVPLHVVRVESVAGLRIRVRVAQTRCAAPKTCDDSIMSRILIRSSSGWPLALHDITRRNCACASRQRNRPCSGGTRRGASRWASSRRGCHCICEAPPPRPRGPGATPCCY